MLPSAIAGESVVDIFRLLEYWAEEPPAHVTLALRYLGERKKKPKTEEQAQGQIMEVAGMMGALPGAMPQQARDLVSYAEEMQAKLHKGKMHGR